MTTAMQAMAARQGQYVAVEIRVRGRVQGVGFRPTVWRLACELGLRGEVLNDAQGVLVRVGGGRNAIAAFIDRMEREPPPLGRIDKIETRAFFGALLDGFRIRSEEHTSELRHRH